MEMVKEGRVENWVAVILTIWGRRFPATSLISRVYLRRPGELILPMASSGSSSSDAVIFER